VRFYETDPGLFVFGTIVLSIALGFALGRLGMIDVKKLESEAAAEVAEEQATAAKLKVKGKLREIASAERVLANLRSEYAAILRDLGSA
jgi:hypothetical protein